MEIKLMDFFVVPKNYIYLHKNSLKLIEITYKFVMGLRYDAGREVEHSIRRG